MPRLILTAALALLCAAPVVAQPAPDQMNKVVAMFISPRSPDERFVQIFVGDCADSMATQAGFYRLALQMWADGAITSFRSVVVPIDWDETQGVDLRRCTKFQPAEAVP